MRCHASQPIMAGSTRVVSSPLPETSLLARSCNKAERERYFVFGESLTSRFSCRFGVGSPRPMDNQEFCTRIAVRKFTTG
jgi:hypothetical protein